MPVIDASIFIAAISPDEGLAEAQNLLATILAEGALTPSLFAYECASVLQTKHRRGIFDQDTRDTLLGYVANAPLTFVAPDAHRMARHVVPLAARRGLSVYDASYLELALRENEALASMDRRLREAAASEGVVLL